MANTAAPRPAANAGALAVPGRTLDPIQRQAAILAAGGKCAAHGTCGRVRQKICF